MSNDDKWHGEEFFDSHRHLGRLESIIEEVQHVVDCNEGIRASDEQYEDCSDWWSIPLLEKLKEAKKILQENY